MALHRRAYVSCDCPDCGDALGEYDAGTVKDARASATALGYTRTKDGLDLCQPCSDRGCRVPLRGEGE